VALKITPTMLLGVGSCARRRVTGTGAIQKGDKMSTTVLEALEGAKINFENLGNAASIKRHLSYMIAMDQLTNAINALENGRDASFVIQDAMFEDVKK